MEPADPHAGKVMKMAAQQEKPMISTQRADPAGGTPGPGAGKAATPRVSPIAAAGSPAFRIRWGRLVLAVAGLLALLTAVVSGVLRLFGIGSGWLPVTALLGAFAAVALLRRLAVRDRRRKINAAFREAMGSPERTPARPSVPEQTPSLPDGRPAARPESPLFDAEAGRDTPEPAPKPLTALELRQAALAEAVASGDASAAMAADTGAVRGGRELGARRGSQAHLRRSAEGRTCSPNAPRPSRGAEGRRETVSQTGLGATGGVRSADRRRF